MKRFMFEERGYALVLTLLFMPVFIGLSLMIIDLGRGNNAHSDLYAAADAVAIAAAGELDGASDAITRAKTAMAEIDSTVSFLSLEDGEGSIALKYVDEEDNEFNVIFLQEIPEFDYIPIDQDWVDDYGATSAENAYYVYVAARSKDLDTIFPMPISWTDKDVPVQARAVATRQIGICEITPMFMCNPFETSAGVGDFQTNFEAGKMNGRLVQLHLAQGAAEPGPGNYGFLDMGSGNNDLSAFFASPETTACYSPDEVMTEPGVKSVAPGLNTRFDIYTGSFGKSWDQYPPAKNVRKGYWDSSGSATDACGDVLYNPDPMPSPPPFFGFPDNANSAANNGANIGSGVWDIETYFLVNHNIDLRPLIDVDTDGNPCVDENGDPACANPNYSATTVSELNAYPSSQFPDGISDPGVNMPSRYAAYLWELDNDKVSDTSTGGETGSPMCSQMQTNPAPIAPPDDPLRRVVQVAIVNCKEALAADPQAFSGKSDILKVEAYASYFLTNPMEGANKVISGELIDSTGVSSLGTLDTFIRAEGILVR